MLDSYHHMIFYPEDAAELAKATAKRKGTIKLSKLPGAILAPHAAYSEIKEALHRSFEVAGDLKVSLVVFLGALHQEVLEQDAPAFLFTSLQDGITIAGKDHSFSSDVIKTLLQKFPNSMRACDSYFEEESALELTLPFINSYLGEVPVLPILSGSASSEQIKIYENVLKTILEYEPNTLFIVSSNACALLPSPQAEEDTQTLINRLSVGENLLENKRGERISSCNTASLSAVNNTLGTNKKWVFTGLFSKHEEHTEIVSMEPPKDKHVWHLSAYKEEENV